MDFELRAAREKLEREQRERKQRAKAKIERESKAKAEAARRRDAIDAAQRSRRLDAARSQLEAEQRLERNLVAGDGIAFSRTLEALPYECGQGDKIKLPPSCFKDLSDLGALDKGPMFFRLSRLLPALPFPLMMVQLPPRRKLILGCWSSRHARAQLSCPRTYGVISLPVVAAASRRWPWLMSLMCVCRREVMRSCSRRGQVSQTFQTTRRFSKQPCGNMPPSRRMISSVSIMVK